MKNRGRIIAIISLLCMILILAAVWGADVYSERLNKNKEIQTETTMITTQSATQNNSQTVADTDSDSDEDLTVLVNADNPVPSDWKTDIVDLGKNQSVDRRAYDDLQKMLSDARKAGFNPLICSSYRTQEKQTKLFENKVRSYKKEGYSDEKAKELALNWVAYPGNSEHQTGLALDIVSEENQILDESQIKSDCQQWLMKNSYKYGFILRYPQDKTDITGIDFEPWHYRYVGKDAAGEIYRKSICLEEYVSSSRDK